MVMDAHGRNMSTKPTEKFSSEKQLLYLNPSPGLAIISPPRRVVITTPKSKPSIPGKAHTPSSIPRIKSLPFSTTSRPNPVKALEKTRNTSRDYSRKNLEKNSYFSSGCTCSTGTSQRLPTTKNNSTTPRAPRSYLFRDSKYTQAYPNSKSSTRLPHLNPKKVRKPINLDTFRPASRQEIAMNICSTSNEGKSSGFLSHKDRSEFADWEFIDWPWVTPYAPLDRITLLSDIKPFNTLSAFKPKHCSASCPWDPNTSSPCIKSISDNDEKVSVVPVRGHKSYNYRNGSSQYIPLTVDQVCWEDDYFGAKHITCPKKAPPLQFVVPKNQSISRNTVWDPAVISIGPVNSVINKNLTEHSADQRENSSKKVCCGDPCSKKLQECTKEIIKCVTKMRKQDGLLLQEVLQAFQDAGRYDRSCNEFRQDLDERIKTRGRRSLEKYLNPDVPDFQPKTNPVFNDYIEVKRLPLHHTTNRGQFPLQEVPSHSRYKENTIINTPQDKHKIPFAESAPNREKITTTRSTKESICEAVSSNKADDIDESLMETCLKKIQMLESEARQQLLRADGISYKPRDPRQFSSFSTDSLNGMSYNIETDDDNMPGRIANAMEHSWAAQMLEKFRNKYPMTGKVKSGPVINIKKKLFCDQQQRLEYLLLQRKENKIYQQIYQMKHSQGNSWGKMYNF